MIFEASCRVSTMSTDIVFVPCYSVPPKMPWLSIVVSNARCVPGGVSLAWVV